jgi:glutathione S-transferase
VYPAAVEALSAVADKLRASSGPYLLGPKPSSLDALLFGHLAFYKHSAIAAPTLRDKVRRDGVSGCTFSQQAKDGCAHNLRFTSGKWP